MSPEKFLFLKEKYADLFDDNPRISAGIECNDGWYDIIDSLLSRIKNRAVAKGLKPKVSLVKEKFGGLRFHLDNSDAEMNAMVDLAETLSYKVCEKCGSPGSRKGTGWTFTMCDPCWKDREKLRKDL